MSTESVKRWLELAQEASDPPNREQYERAVAQIRYAMPAALAVIEAARTAAALPRTREISRVLEHLDECLAAFEALS